MWKFYFFFVRKNPRWSARNYCLGLIIYRYLPEYNTYNLFKKKLHFCDFCHHFSFWTSKVQFYPSKLWMIAILAVFTFFSPHFGIYPNIYPSTRCDHKKALFFQSGVFATRAAYLKFFFVNNKILFNRMNWTEFHSNKNFISF